MAGNVMSLKAPQVGPYIDWKSASWPVWYWLSPSTATASGSSSSTRSAVSPWWQFVAFAFVAWLGLHAMSPAATSVGESGGGGGAISGGGGLGGAGAGSCGAGVSGVPEPGELLILKRNDARVLPRPRARTR